MNKNLNLISTTSVQERSKTGVKNVFFIAELLNYSVRILDGKDVAEFSYNIKTVEKKADNTLPLNPDGSIVSNYRNQESGSIVLDTIETELTAEGTYNEIQDIIKTAVFLEYANTEGIYALEWEVLNI